MSERVRELALRESYLSVRDGADLSLYCASHRLSFRTRSFRFLKTLPRENSSEAVLWPRDTLPLASGHGGGMCLWAMRKSERCQVNCGSKDESLSVWIFWIAKGKCSRTCWRNSMAVRVLLWS